MRITLRRVRRLGAFLLLGLSVWWVLLRRRSVAVRWVEPPAGLPAEPAEPGAPGELPEDVLATDAGLTELPGDVLATESVEAAGTVVVDETLVAELLAEAPADAAPSDADLAAPAPSDAAPSDAAPAAPGVTGADLAWTAADDEPTETELVAPELGIDEPTGPVARGAIAYGDEESSIRIPMPTFSELPTMEIPAVTDNLRAVRGIGPSMERMLHGLGIISFRQLAMLDGAELERVRGELSDFRSRIEREDWVGQARELHKTKYGRDPS